MRPVYNEQDRLAEDEPPGPVPLSSTPAARRPGVQSIDRAVAILKCFGSRRQDLGISDIARMTGLTTSTTHRLLVAMQENHLVRQTSGRRYALGPLVIQLARSGAISTTLRDAALPAMRSLRDEVDETVGLHELLPSGERVVVDQVESYQELRRTYTDVGVPIPLPQGAPGKAILAHLSRERQESCLARPIDPATPLTITDPDLLRDELAEVRRHGYAGSHSERTPGIRAVASPVFDFTQRVIGAIGASVPEVRMDDARTAKVGEMVRETAWSVSEALGATPEGVAETLHLAAGPE